MNPAAIIYIVGMGVPWAVIAICYFIILKKIRKTNRYLVIGFEEKDTFGIENLLWLLCTLYVRPCDPLF